MRPVDDITAGAPVQATVARRASAGADRRRLVMMACWVGLVTLAFAGPLAGLLSFAAGHELFSYIPLVPFISAWLLYQRPPAGVRLQTSVAPALLAAGAGVAFVRASFEGATSLPASDAFALAAAAYVAALWAGGFLLLGAPWMKVAAFPAAFLVFLIPLPEAVVRGLEQAAVIGSAEVSAALFRLTGTPILRDGTIFALPTIVLEVARECSGIRSSWILLLTSLIGAYLFLARPWTRAVLVAFIVPLAIIRNGFRILTIGLLCVHVGPHMIDSPIHHRGGPIFFALSLVPLFGLLLLLRRRERRRPRAT